TPERKVPSANGDQEAATARASSEQAIEPLRSENPVVGLLQDIAPVDGGAADAAARAPEREAQERLAQIAGRSPNTEAADENFRRAAEHIHRWTSPLANSFSV